MHISELRNSVLRELDTWLERRQEKLKQVAEDQCPLSYSDGQDLEEYSTFLEDAVRDKAAHLGESAILELNSEADSFLSDHGPTGSVAQWNEEGIDNSVLRSVSYEPSRFSPPSPVTSRKGTVAGVLTGISPVIATAIVLTDPLTKTWLASVFGSSVVGGGAGFTVYRRIERQKQKERRQRLLNDAASYIEREMQAVEKWIKKEVVDEYVDLFSSFVRREEISQSGEAHNS